MTYAEELDFWLHRHNEPTSTRVWSSGLMAAVAWVVSPLILLIPMLGITAFYTALSHGDFWAAVEFLQKPTIVILAGLGYFAANAILCHWLVFRRVEHEYSAGYGMRILFWPAYITAEAVNQWRQLLRFSPAQRLVAQSLLLRLHLAGQDGIRHAPADAAEERLIERLGEINAVRINKDSLTMRLWRREPDFAQAIPTTLDPADLPPIGLIAGGGHLPLLQAVGLHQAGRRVIGIGLTGQYDPAFPSFCDEFMEASPLRPNTWVRRLRARGAFEAVMVGHVQKTKMQNPMEVARHFPDLAALRLWFGRHDRRSQGLLHALAEHLKNKGLLLVSTTQYIPDHLATLGTMSRRPLTQEQKLDIKLALPILAELNKLDIGQGLCVKGGDVVALEAMEGTDRMIARAGELCPRGGWTLVKGADPRKDLRFDVPTVGLQTIENLKKAGAGCLAVVAGRTIFVNKPEVIAAADRAGLVVVGFELD